MGLERRGNNYYYYKKERDGGKVCSIYIGSGDTARVFHAWDELERGERSTSRDNLKAERIADERIDAQIDTVAVELEPLVEALFLIKGYHQHSRVWRRQNDATAEETKRKERLPSTLKTDE